MIKKLYVHSGWFTWNKIQLFVLAIRENFVVNNAAWKYSQYWERSTSLFTFSCRWGSTWKTSTPCMSNISCVFIVKNILFIIDMNWLNSDLNSLGMFTFEGQYLFMRAACIYHNTMICVFYLPDKTSWLNNSKNTYRLVYKYAKNRNFHQNSLNWWYGMFWSNDFSMFPLTLSNSYTPFNKPFVHSVTFKSILLFTTQCMHFIISLL